MKKRGFVLMETIVVIVVVTVSLVTIFSSYNKILTKVKSENKYDTSEYIYATRLIKKYMKENISSISPVNITELTTPLNDYSDDVGNAMDVYNIKKIYVVKIYDGKIPDPSLQKFDGYMVDYLRKLDIPETDHEVNLIIVEYQRPVRDENYEVQKFYNSNADDGSDILYETYIASLRW